MTSQIDNPTHLLKALYEKNLSYNELHALIKVTIRLAEIIARSRYNYVFQRTVFHGITIQEIITDSITPLFIGSKTNEEIPLKKALLTWSQPLDSEESAYFFLSQIIGSRIEQEISKKLKETDPFFGKILRSINYVVEKNKYAKTTYFGVVHIIENSDRLITQKPPSAEFIEALPNSLLHGTNEKIIALVFDYLKSETDFFPAIPLNALIRRIKKYHSDDFSYYSSSGEANLEDSINVQKIVSSGLEETVSKLNQMYVSKGKLNEEEADNFKKALNDYAADLSDGGVSRGLYEYLSRHMLTLSKTDFYEKYHQSFDYLIRILKKSIAEKLHE
ncbi:MAG: hypothetical protein M1480_14675 [Bacteroidetes bacterium]|nr:hypothetical protein [Bacteroidota bacterium]